MTSVMFVLNVDDDKSGAKMDGPHEEQESERAKPRQKINERRSVKADQMRMRVPFAYDESIRIVVNDFVTENTTRRPCNNCGGCEGVKIRGAKDASCWPNEMMPRLKEGCQANPFVHRGNIQR